MFDNMYEFLEYLYPSGNKYKGKLLLFNVDTKTGEFFNVDLTFRTLSAKMKRIFLAPSRIRFLTERGVIFYAHQHSRHLSCHVFKHGQPTHEGIEVACTD